VPGEIRISCSLNVKNGEQIKQFRLEKINLTSPYSRSNSGYHRLQLYSGCPSYKYILDAPDYICIPDVPGYKYIPNVPGYNYIPDVPNYNYIPDVTGSNYIPNVPGSNYIPDVTGSNYIPDVPGSNYIPDVTGSNYIPDVSVIITFQIPRCRGADGQGDQVVRLPGQQSPRVNKMGSKMNT
jgi:hypothetical protein